MIWSPELACRLSFIHFVTSQNRHEQEQAFRADHDVPLCELHFSSGLLSVSLPVRLSFLFLHLCLDLSFLLSAFIFSPRCLTLSAAALIALSFLFPLFLFSSVSCCCLLINLPASLSNLTAGSFLCWNGAHAGLLPAKVRCGTRLFGPPSSSSSSSLLLPLLLPPLGSVQMAEAGRPDLGGVLAEQHLSPALERAYRSHDLATRAALLPAPASLLSQVSHKRRTYSWCFLCRWQFDSILIESQWCRQKYSSASKIYSCYIVQINLNIKLILKMCRCDKRD